MYKIKVYIDTGNDCVEFVRIANSFPETTKVYLEDGNGIRVDAKSLMGVMYGKFEFENRYVVSDDERISTRFLKFIV